MRSQPVSKTIITATVVVVAVVATLYFFPRSDPWKSGNLKTYANDTYGVTFDYPANYDLTETSKSAQEGGPGQVVTLTRSGLFHREKDATAISVGMYDYAVAKNTKQNPTEAWIRSASSSKFQYSENKQIGDTRIGDKPAKLYTWTSTQHGTTVVTTNKNSIIMFTVTYGGNDDMEKRKDFAKLMDTVQLYDPTQSTTTNSSVTK